MFLHADSHVNADEDGDGRFDWLENVRRVIAHTLQLAGQFARFPKHYVHAGDMIDAYDTQAWPLFMEVSAPIRESEGFISKTFVRGNHDPIHPEYPFPLEQVADLGSGARLIGYDYFATQLYAEQRPGRMALQAMVDGGVALAGAALVITAHDPILIGPPWDAYSVQPPERRRQVLEMAKGHNPIFLAGHFHYPLLASLHTRQGEVILQVASPADLRGSSYWVITIDSATLPHVRNAHLIAVRAPVQVMIARPQFGGLLYEGEGPATVLVRAVVAPADIESLEVFFDRAFVTRIPCQEGLCQAEIALPLRPAGEHALTVSDPTSGAFESIPVFTGGIPAGWMDVVRWHTVGLP